MTLVLLALAGLTMIGDGTALPQPLPLWTEDVLIWDMSESSTWAGSGYTYCDGICDPFGNEYAVAIIDSTGPQGSTLKIFEKPYQGDWSKLNQATGGGWVMTDPQLVLHGDNPDPDSNYISIFLAATIPDSATTPLGFRLHLDDSLTFDDYMQPDWPFTADTLKSISVVCEPIANEIWLFGEDTNHNLHLTRSPDNGLTWSPLDLVATDAERPSAALGANGWVYLTYKRYSDNMIMCSAFKDLTSFETEVAPGFAFSAPICAADQSMNSDVAVIYHTTGYDIILALSADSGSTWNPSVPIAKGRYPFIDVFAGTSNCALTYISELDETIYFSAADDLALLPTVSPIPVSDQYPFLYGPPVIRHGVLPTEVSLFYMGRDSFGYPHNLWYDTSLLHGVSGTGTEPAFAAGPNPFTAMTGISFELPEPMNCTLDIYSMDGRLVERVFSGVTSGESVQTGSGLPSGVYTAVLRTGSTVTSRRIVKI